MRYRWKLLVLLLIIGLAPILAMRTGFVHNIRRLGNLIVDRTSEDLIVRTENAFRLLVEGYAGRIWADRSRIEALLICQRLEVERALALRNAPRPNRVYFTTDFDESNNLPEDAAPSNEYLRIRPEREAVPLIVSTSTPVFAVAPDINPEKLEGDIDRLSVVTPILSELKSGASAMILWQTITLKNGLFMSYPAHGGFPCEVDPRQQPWYWEKEPVYGDTWSQVYVDPVSRQVVFAATLPLRNPDGEFIGVTSLVVPLQKIFSQGLLEKNPAPETRYFMGFVFHEPDAGKRGLLSFASDDQSDIKSRSWRTTIKPERIVSEDTDEFEALMDDFDVGKSGARRMRFHGRDSLWVYGPILYESKDYNADLILIAPYDRILEPARQMDGTVQGIIDNLVSLTRYGVTGMAALMVILAFLFARTVTKPLGNLVEGARRLARGDFNAHADIRSKDEFGDLARVFNSLGPRLKEHYAMTQALSLAREVQQSLLPHHEPSIPELNVAGASVYCDETGGDYYDFLEAEELGHGDLVVLVGDISGHGVQSALLMTSARAFLRQRLSMPGTLSQTIEDVNRQVYRDVSASGGFMTLFCLRLDMASRLMTWVRAGHDPAIVYDPDTDAFTELEGPGLALGVDDTFRFEERNQPIKPNNIILIGTDGIWEAHDRLGRMFGKERLHDIVSASVHQSAAEIVNQVVTAIKDFRAGLDQEDDITLVVVKVRG